MTGPGKDVSLLFRLVVLKKWLRLNKLDMKLNPTKQRQRRNKKYGTSIDFGPPLSFSSSGQGESETASKIISLNSVRQPDAYKRSRPQLNTRASYVPLPQLLDPKVFADYPLFVALSMTF